MRIRDNGQGCTDEEMVTALVLLNLAGGDCVRDIEALEGDEGFFRVLDTVKGQGMSRKERRALERRWRKQRRRAFPSTTAIFRYLAAFHDPAQ